MEFLEDIWTGIIRNFEKRKEASLFAILRSIAPKDLKQDFHITIFFNNDPDKRSGVLPLTRDNAKKAGVDEIMMPDQPDDGEKCHEITYEEVDLVKGMNVSIITTANTDDEARELLKLLGMPFKK